MTRLDEIRKAELKKLNDRIAALEVERDEWKKRAEQAAHIGEDDKVGFDWNVLTQIESLEAVAEAARTGKGLDDALDALDALKGAE